jgi:hypothetical protein
MPIPTRGNTIHPATSALLGEEFAVLALWCLADTG